MSLSTRTYVFTDGTTAYGSQVETEISNLSNLFNSLDAASTSWTNVKAGTINATTLLKGAGTNTNDNAATGNIGETVTQVGGGSSAANNVWGNIASIALTAGDWLLFGNVQFVLNSATVTACNGAISAFSGNTTTDHANGDNLMSSIVPTAFTNSGCTIAAWRVSIAGSATYYLKEQMAFSAGTPQTNGRLTAVRIR